MEMENGAIVSSISALLHLASLIIGFPAKMFSPHVLPAKSRPITQLPHARTITARWARGNSSFARRRPSFAHDAIRSTYTIATVASLVSATEEGMLMSLHQSS